MAQAAEAQGSWGGGPVGEYGGTGGGSIVTTWLTATHTTALGAICSYCM